MTEEHEQEVHLSDYLTVIMKRKWIILTCLLVTVMITAYVTFTQTPVYKATTSLIIEKQEPNILQIEDIIASGSSSNTYYQTQYEIIKSRSLARKVASELDLYTSREFNPEPPSDPISRTKRWATSLVASVQRSVIDFIFPNTQAGDQKDVIRLPLYEGIDAAQDKILDKFRARLSVEPVRETNMVQISFEATEPRLAAQTSNAVAKAYIEHNLETKMETIKQAVAWLKTRLEEERQAVQQAQNTFMEYRQEHNIITDISPETERIRAEKLADLDSKITEAKTNRIKAQNRYEKAQDFISNSGNLDSLPSILSNEVTSSIQKSEMELSITLSDLSKKYGANHPQIQAIESQLQNLKQKKLQALKTIVTSLRNEYQTLLSEEKMLEQTLEEEKQEAMELNQIAIQYGVLKRQAQNAKEMYDLLVKRFKEASLTEDIKTVNARIVDSSQVPESPDRPQKKRNLLLAVVLGMFVGTGLSFFTEYMDNTLKQPEDLTQKLGIAYLGMIPAMKLGKNLEPAQVCISDPHSIYSEAYRGVRTNLLFSAADTTPTTVLIASAGPGEGKTVTAMNLAVTLAHAGTSTVLVDCDLRKPMLHKHLKLSRDKGLSHVLTGSMELSEVQFPTEIENLTFVPSGPTPPNPSELLGSQSMQAMLFSLAESYDRVIIDSPPITAVSDSSILASQADGTILVVQAFETPLKMVQTSLDQIRTVQAKVLGGVLNGVDMEKEGAYYSYYSYYYYHSTGDKKGKKREEAV